MSYQKSSVDSLLGYINAKNPGQVLTTADLTFSAPKLVAGTWREANTQRNTAVRIMGVPSGKYGGRQVITYDRLNLASLAKISGFQVRATGAKTVHDLIPNLRYYNGLRFTTDDLENTPITQDESGKLIAVLSAKANSLGWVGSVQLEVKAGGQKITEAVSVTNLNGLNYPTTSDADVYALLYTYGYDFTAYMSTLINLQAGKALTSDQLSTLVDMLKAVDVSSGKALWNADSTKTEWSLDGATVTYGGLNNDPKLPTNPAYKYVVGLKLRDAVTTPKGTLYLHFNDPFNPDDF